MIVKVEPNSILVAFFIVFVWPIRKGCRRNTKAVEIFGNLVQYAYTKDSFMLNVRFDYKAAIDKVDSGVILQKTYHRETEDIRSEKSCNV